jgi:hypothetical protein
MDEFFYGLNSGTITFSILALMLLAMEAGSRLGLRTSARVTAQARSQIETVQTSLLGLLALMLGFTFSIALDRHNNRSRAVVNEANAIGTAFLRTDLLPDAPRADARRAFSEYADVRARMSVLTFAQREERAELQARVLALQDGLWKQAAEAARQSPSPAITGLYVQALNEMFDAYSSYLAEVLRHVPHLVLVLMFSAFVVSGAIIGFSAGLAGHRPAGATFLMIAVVSLLMYMVMDLDRPHRGIIKVSSQSLLDVKASIEAVVPR